MEKTPNNDCSPLKSQKKSPIVIPIRLFSGIIAQSTGSAQKTEETPNNDCAPLKSQKKSPIVIPFRLLSRIIAQSIGSELRLHLIPLNPVINWQKNA
jgi:hypothetical protein